MTPWMHARLDWLVTEERRTIDPSSLPGETAFHYSIPVLDESGDGRVEPVEAIGSGKLLLSGGEVLVSKLNPRLPRVLRAQAHEIPTVASTEFIALRVGPKVEDRFLRYWLGSESTRQYLNGATMSVTRSQQRVRPAVLTKMWLSVPPLESQQAIADYLDAETARIDALIEKKQRLVQCLEDRSREYERSVLLEGGHPTRPLRWAIRIRSGDSIPAEDFSPDGSTPVVGGNGRMGLTSRPGNVITPCIAVGRVGALCGNAHLVDPPAWVTDNALWIHSIEGFEREFLWMVLQAVDLNSMADKTAQPLITGDTVKRLGVPCPSLSAQRQISDHLGQRRAELGHLLAMIRHQLGLLAEHRQAIVTATVTGETDIQGVAA